MSARSVVAIGLDRDPTLAHFVRTAIAVGLDPQADLELVNLRAAVDGAWHVPVVGSEAAVLEFSGRRLELDPEAAYFCRLIDLSAAPGAGMEADRADRWRGLLGALAAWLELIPGPVVNRPGHRADNGSKPLHEHLLRAAGLRVPDSLTSSDGSRLAGFAAGGDTIAKTVAGVRADTRAVTAEDFHRFDPRRGPVHVQRRVRGRDVRAHVVGDAVHALDVETAQVDYRRADDARYRPHRLPRALQARIADVSREAGLAFAGWDFKLDLGGTYWCLEANPMPGYDSYDRHLSGAITRSLVERLR